VLLSFSFGWNPPRGVPVRRFHGDLTATPARFPPASPRRGIARRGFRNRLRDGSLRLWSGGSARIFLPIGRYMFMREGRLRIGPGRPPPVAVPLLRIDMQAAIGIE